MWSQGGTYCEQDCKSVHLECPRNNIIISTSHHFPYIIIIIIAVIIIINNIIIYHYTRRWAAACYTRPYLPSCPNSNFKLFHVFIAACVWVCQQLQYDTHISHLILRTLRSPPLIGRIIYQRLENPENLKHNIWRWRSGDAQTWFKIRIVVDYVNTPYIIPVISDLSICLGVLRYSYSNTINL